MEKTHDTFIGDIESNLERQLKHISDLEDTNKELEAAKIDLTNQIMLHQEEKMVTLSQMQQLEASMKNLENQLAERLETMSIMQKTHDASITNLESTLEQKSQHISNLEKANKDLEAAKTNVYNEFIVHNEEKNAVHAQLQHVEASMKHLEDQLEQEVQKTAHVEKTHHVLIVDLQSKLEQHVNQISNLEEVNKELDKTKKDLYNEVMLHKEEKAAALTQVQQLEASVKNLENQLSQKLEKLSIMQKTHDASINDLESTLEYQAQHIASLEKTNKNLEAAKNDVYNEFIVHKEEKTATLAQLQQVQASVKNLENRLEQEETKVLDMKKAKEALILENSNLHDKIMELHVEKNEAFASITDLESKLEQQVQHISDLQDTNKDLESAKINLCYEITMYQEEKATTLAQLQKLENFVKNLENQLEVQLEKVSDMKKTHDAIVADLESKLGKQSRHISKLDDTNKALEEAKTNLYNEVIVHQEGKTLAIAQFQQLEAYAKNVENQLTQQLEKISDMQITRDAFVNDLKSTLEHKAQDIKDLEMANKVLETTNIDLYNEVSVHKEEKATILAQLQHVEAYMKNLENQLEQEREKISDVNRTNEALLLANANLQNETKELQGEKNEALASISDLECKLEQQAQHLSNLKDTNKDLELANINVCNEVMVYQDEKIATLHQLQQAEASVKDLEYQLEQQLEKVSHLEKTNDVLVADLESKLEQQAINISNLQETNRELTTEKIDLYNEVRVYQEEKTATLSQLQQLEAFVKNLENQLEQELDKNLVMINTYDASITYLLSKLEQQAQDLSTLEKTNKDLEAVNVALYHELRTHKEEKNVTISQLQHVEASVADLEIKLEQQLQKSSDLQKINEALMLKNSDLKHEIIVLQGEKDEALASIVDLQSNLEQQFIYVSNLQDANKDLQAIRTDMTKENRKLQKQVQDLEVQLQLVKKKLKVTDVENKWKQDRYAATVETMQVEIQNLKQLVSLQEETLEEAKEHAELGGSSLVEKMNELESSITQGFTRFVYRSSASSEELKGLRKLLNDHLDEQKKLLEKKDVMSISLRDKENVLSGMVKNDDDARILDTNVQDKGSGEERINYMTIFSTRWPVVRRKGRRNSYSAGEKSSDQVAE